MSKAVGVLLFALSVTVLTACDDQEEPDCSRVDAPCGVEDDLQCALAGEAIEVCRRNAAGCLEWALESECGGAQTCSSAGDAPQCLCQDECEDGESQCDGDVVQACEADADGCLAWADDTDCADSGGTCEAAGGEAGCLPGCEDSCPTDGATRCSADMIETCSAGGDGCLAWTTGTDCAAGGQACDATSGEALCVDVCVDQCDADGTSSCVGTVITTCAMGEDGCLDLISGTDCAVEADYCDDSGDEPACGTCENSCAAAGDTMCAGDFVMTCTADELGCLSWEASTNCTTLDPSQVCHVADGVASCFDAAAGETCDRATVITPPAVDEGVDFFAWYDEDLMFSDGSCGWSNGNDAVFEVSLLAGDELVVHEEDLLHTTMLLQSACGAAEACLAVASDLPPDSRTTLRYVARENETVYVIVEAGGGQPWTNYELHFDLAQPEECDSGADEDIDGLTDCDDPDCFGLSPCDAAETNCTDGADNDGDDLVDCADDDCDAVPACQPFQGIYEVFGFGNVVDLAGAAITFTPDGAAPNGYAWSVEDGVTGFAVEPGSGTTSRVVSLGDDDFEEYAFEHLSGFELYGTDYTSLFVSSNGRVTFGEGSTVFAASREELFRVPSIAPLFSDLNPSAATGAGTVTIDETADSVAVTYQGVPFYSTTAANDVQLVLNADGSFELVYVALGDAGERTVVVGVSGGPGLLPYPRDVNFVTDTPELCDDGLDNDGDGAIDCADSNCFGPPDCATETVCGDLIDNDLDGVIDCEDPDCAAAPTCIPAQGVWEWFETGETVDLQGTTISFTPDAADPAGYTWTLATGIAIFPFEPGTGTVSQVLPLTDESDQLWALTTMGTFSFYGVDNGGFYVTSNGYLTFGESAVTYATDPTSCFAAPSVMGLRQDLDPGSASTAGPAVITVDEFAGLVAVTYENVPHYGFGEIREPNSFQIVLFADGAIDVTVLAVSSGTEPRAIGLSSGGTGPAPAETNFAP